MLCFLHGKPNLSPNNRKPFVIILFRGHFLIVYCIIGWAGMKKKVYASTEYVIIIGRNNQLWWRCWLNGSYWIRARHFSDLVLFQLETEMKLDQREGSLSQKIGLPVPSPFVQVWDGCDSGKVGFLPPMPRENGFQWNFPNFFMMSWTKTGIVPTPGVTCSLTSDEGQSSIYLGFNFQIGHILTILDGFSSFFLQNDMNELYFQIH